MANRVLIGNRSTGGYGLYVSKANSNVLNCDRKELLFDSSQKRAAEVYAGGNQTTINTSGQNIYTTGSKASLGYIPLVIHTESIKGEQEDVFNQYYGPWHWTDEVAFLKTTLTTITGSSMLAEDLEEMDSSGDDGIDDARSMSNVRWLALKIPCAYGYMTSANFDT